MKISRIDSKGFFTLIFSEPMNVTCLINEANNFDAEKIRQEARNFKLPYKK